MLCSKYPKGFCKSIVVNMNNISFNDINNNKSFMKFSENDKNIGDMRYLSFMVAREIKYFEKGEIDPMHAANTSMIQFLMQKLYNVKVKNNNVKTVKKLKYLLYVHSKYEDLLISSWKAEIITVKEKLKLLSSKFKSGKNIENSKLDLSKYSKILDNLNKVCRVVDYNFQVENCNSRKNNFNNHFFRSNKLSQFNRSTKNSNSLNKISYIVECKGDDDNHSGSMSGNVNESLNNDDNDNKSNLNEQDNLSNMNSNNPNSGINGGNNGDDDDGDDDDGDDNDGGDDDDDSDTSSDVLSSHDSDISDMESSNESYADPLGFSTILNDKTPSTYDNINMKYSPNLEYNHFSVNGYFTAININNGKVYENFVNSHKDKSDYIYYSSNSEMKNVNFNLKSNLRLNRYFVYKTKSGAINFGMSNQLNGGDIIVKDDKGIAFDSKILVDDDEIIGIEGNYYYQCFFTYGNHWNKELLVKFTNDKGIVYYQNAFNLFFVLGGASKYFNWLDPGLVLTFLYGCDSPSILLKIDKSLSGHVVINLGLFRSKKYLKNELILIAEVLYWVNYSSMSYDDLYNKIWDTVEFLHTAGEFTLSFLSSEDLLRLNEGAEAQIDSIILGESDDMFNEEQFPFQRFDPNIERHLQVVSVSSKIDNSSFNSRFNPIRDEKKYKEYVKNRNNLNKLIKHHNKKRRIKN